MIFPISGGGAKLYAAIGVTYPKGSVLTCSNADGSKVFTAENTDGEWVFAIPEAGTWTVKSTYGTNSKEQAFDITEEGQFEAVELSYGVILYEAGNEYTAITGGWTTNKGTLTKKADRMVLAQSKVYNDGFAHTVNKISVDSYKALYFDAEFQYPYNGSYSGTRVGLTSGFNPDYNGGGISDSVCATTATSASRKVYSVDVSKVTGSYYLYFSNYNEGVACDAIVYKVYAVT